MKKKSLLILLILLCPFLFAATLQITNSGGGKSLDIVNTRSASLTFDGLDDYIDLKDPFEWVFQDSFSISLWVKLDDARPPTIQRLLGSRDAAENKIDLQVRTNGVIRFVYQANTNIVSTSMTAFSDGAHPWKHMVIVADATVSGAGGIRLYNNMVQDGSGDTSSVVFADFSLLTQNIFLGARNADGGDQSWFAGQLVDIRIFSQVLSPAEIAQIYRGQIITNGLVGWWPLQESGLSETAYDVSGNANHGELQNFTLADGWAHIQNKIHYPLMQGYESYTDDATGLVEIKVPYRIDGTLITPTITGYTKQIGNSGRGYNRSQIEVMN
ncbi:MAG: LamG domain-containing protein [Chloroflexi bacterium]|nr:LamG domain-containing protein [Chloroflexota bacterium]